MSSCRPSRSHIARSMPLMQCSSTPRRPTFRVERYIISQHQPVSEARRPRTIGASPAIASIEAAHGGHEPTNGQLTQRQAELLDGSLAGADEALSQVPGRLEVELPPHPAPIPAEDVKINPTDP